jgi:AcrR family transcriptional regulator
MYRNLNRPKLRPQNGEPMTPVERVVASDGRHRRSERSRERILEALAKAFQDPDFELSPEHVASSAGVSVSTLFRHFGDIRGLNAAMRERVNEEVLPHFAAGPFEGSRLQRVRELLRRRVAIFEFLAPFRRIATRQAKPSVRAREESQQLAQALRAQMADALRPELARAGGDDDAEILAALLSFDAWNHMRLTQGLGSDATQSLLERAVITLLAARD